MLDWVEGVAWRMLAAIGHGRPSLLALASAATLALTTAANGWPVVSSVPNFYSSTSRLLNDPCFHTGQKGAYAISLTSRQAILDVDGDALLIPASATKPSTGTALLRVSSHPRCRSAFLTAAPLRHEALQGDL
jgi:hypothetical protein